MKIASVVRLLKSPEIAKKGVWQYCAQMLIPERDLGWFNIGNIFIERSSGRIDWTPLPEYSKLLPVIGIAPGGSMSGEGGDSPYTFAMYKLKVLAEKALEEDPPGNDVVPQRLEAGGYADESPVFMDPQE
jgi:hypothetical protein